MKTFTVYVFLALVIFLDSKSVFGSKTQKPKTTTRHPGIPDRPKDVNDPHIQDLSRAAVANYTLSGTNVCLKHAYSLESVEEAILRMNMFCTCHKITLTMVYNSNCPFAEAKVCKIKPNKSDKKYKLVVEVTGKEINEKLFFKFLSHPIETTDC